MLIFGLVSPPHSCVSANGNQYINLVCICACDDRVSLSSKVMLLGKCHWLTVEMTHNGSNSFIPFEGPCLEKICLVTFIMARKTWKWCTSFMSTRPIWGLRNPRKEGRIALVGEVPAGKPWREFLRTDLLADDWSSGLFHCLVGPEPQGIQDHKETLADWVVYVILVTANWKCKVVFYDKMWKLMFYG